MFCTLQRVRANFVDAKRKFAELDELTRQKLDTFMIVSRME
jgi:hypothetical protein